MIRLSLLQFRVQVITAAAALAAFAVLLAATGPHLAGLYNASGLSACQPASCGHLASNFLQQLYAAGTYWVLYLLGIMLIVLTPAVIGLFWGAPLIARELETGTSALAWSQSVTRTRWLAVKLAVAAWPP
jgi:ABC-type transport system involved in multi-copper enzyme maturation permease subunit